MRSRPRHALALVALLGALASGGVPRPAEACCTAFPLGGRPVEIAAQEILVVWDPVTKMEHFVRKAQFDGRTAKDEPDSGFGFLVPSPTRPEVEAASGGVFDSLAEVSRPRIEERTRWEVSLMPLLAYPFALTMRAGTKGMAFATDGIDVLEQRHVAGYDVAILAATDPKSLTDWLKANGYGARPELQEWARPYIAKGWIITAFRYAKRDRDVTTDAVRMSFRTDVPLFPYRVPTDVLVRPEGGHLLRTYVVAPGRASGTLGEGANARPWEVASVKRAVPLSSSELARLVGVALPAGALTSPARRPGSRPSTTPPGQAGPTT